MNNSLFTNGVANSNQSLLGFLYGIVYPDTINMVFLNEAQI